MNLLIILAAAVILFFVTVMAVDCNRFTIREYSIPALKLSKNVKIVLLSDLHGKSFGKKNEKLLRAVQKADPDMILIAGDMYTSVKNGDTKTARELVCKLAEQYPVYYGNGNHEHKTRIHPEIFGTMYQDFSEEIERAGVAHPVNERISLPELNMDLYGLEIEREYYRKWKPVAMQPSYLEGLLGKADPSHYSVLIAHNPEYFEAYAGWGADLTVSGHVHGGLMRLPVLGGVISPALRLFPKYDGGEFKSGKAAMILSRGLGTHTLPIRIFNPGELVVIELNADNR